MAKFPRYVLIRPDNGYPVIVYADKDRAEFVASKNGYRVVAVRGCKPEKKEECKT